MPQPFEVCYTTVGKQRERDVIGVLCPTPVALHMGIADPIFVSMGDVIVDWELDVSDGYRALFEWPSSNKVKEQAEAAGRRSMLNGELEGDA